MTKLYYIENERGYKFDGYLSETSIGWSAFIDDAKTYNMLSSARRQCEVINAKYGRKVAHIETLEV